MSADLHTSARQQVLNRLRTWSDQAKGCGFVEHNRVQAALQLEREGVLTCQFERVGAVDVLVCRIVAVRRVPPRPFGGSAT